MNTGKPENPLSHPRGKQAWLLLCLRQSNSICKGQLTSNYKEKAEKGLSPFMFMNVLWRHAYMHSVVFGVSKHCFTALCTNFVIWKYCSMQFHNCGHFHTTNYRLDIWHCSTRLHNCGHAMLCLVSNHFNGNYLFTQLFSNLLATKKRCKNVLI